MSITLKVLWKETDSIALALSGGIDSMVLYHLLRTTYRHTYQNLTLFHVNHGVRKESDEEERILRTLAKQHGHQFLSKKLNIEAFTQQKGRIERYNFFTEMMESHRIDFCLTAHHQDDNIETILQELLTNRYLYGIGIPLQEGKFLRPMINLKKERIFEYATRKEVRYLLDASNERDDYTRNYLRHHVISAIDDHEHLQLESLLHFRNDYNKMLEVVETDAENFIGKNTVHTRSAFNELNHMVKVCVLSKLFQGYVERSYIEECIRMLKSDVAQNVVKSNVHALNISYDTFFVQEEVEKEDVLVNCMEIVSIGKHLFNGYEINVTHISEPIIVRTKKPGDRINIPNLGTKKISRVFIDKKIPNSERKKMPIVMKLDGQIIAVGPIYNIIKSLNKKKQDINLEIKECSHDT